MPKIGINYKNGVDNKIKYLKYYFHKNSINKENVLYIENDLNDLECMKYVGFPVAAYDAVDLVKNSKIILDSKGGDGAIRGVIILKAFNMEKVQKLYVRLVVIILVTLILLWK